MSAILNQSAIRAVQLQQVLDALLGFREPFPATALSHDTRVALRASLEEELQLQLKGIKLVLGEVKS